MHAHGITASAYKINTYACIRALYEVIVFKKENELMYATVTVIVQFLQTIDLRKKTKNVVLSISMGHNSQ